MNARTIGMAVVILLLAGCDEPPPQTVSSRGPGQSFAMAEGKSFYLFRAGYTCGGPQPGTPVLASWVDRIEVHEGRLVRWGSRCGGEGLPLPSDERAVARLSGDGTRLMLAEKVYRLSANPQREAEVRP